jgi:hypothetical protein
MEVTQSAYEHNQAGSVPLAHDVGMQIEIPSAADDDVFIPYDVGDIQHDIVLKNILITALDLESVLPVDKIDMHAVREVTVHQSVMESQLTMQPDLYQMTDSQLFLTQQSDNETPQSVAPMTDSLVFLMHQSDNETPQPASIGNIGGDMVDSDDELLAHVDTLVQESRAPMYEVVEESTAPPLLAQKLNEVTEQNKVVEDTTVATAVAQKDDEVVEESTVTPLLVLTRHNSPRTTPMTSPILHRSSRLQTPNSESTSSTKTFAASSRGRKRQQLRSRSNTRTSSRVRTAASSRGRGGRKRKIAANSVTSNRVGRGLPDFDVNKSDTNVTKGITTPSGQAAVEAEVMEAMMEADECCYTCGKSPCEWIEFGLPAISELKNRFCIDTAKSHGYIVDISNGEHVPNKNVRFSCYHLFTYRRGLNN